MFSLFKDEKTIDGRHYETFIEAAKAAGYMSDDSYYQQAMEEAANFHMPYQLRGFFACLLVYCEVSNPTELWQTFKTEMAADFARNQFLSSQAYESLAYHDILQRLSILGQHINEFLQRITYEPVEIEEYVNYEEHQNIGSEKYEMLNMDQKKRGRRYNPISSNKSR